MKSSQYDIAVIGAGPRGLGVLERLGAILEAESVPYRLAVHLVGPGEPGQGAHPASQPHYLLTNTR